MPRKKLPDRTVKNIHGYWKKPFDGKNSPESYLEGNERSNMLLRFVTKYATKKTKILEIGCNIGRNLNCLHSAGFKNLTGIEISRSATKALKKHFPLLAEDANIITAPVEEAIKEFRKNHFGLVFTMAVLEHIHTDSEWIFAEIVRITRKHLITIEDEEGSSWRHFPREYKKIFTGLGMKHVKGLRCHKIPRLGRHFFVRVFAK